MKTNILSRFVGSLTIAIVVAAASFSVAAQVEADWHGFVAQGLIKADDSSFVNTDGDISAELTELGLNSLITLSPAWRIAGQVVYLDGGNRYPPGFRLDYLFIDWNFYHSLDWQANAYVGRFKNQHWLYSSTRDVPFTRPSIILPQSVYFDAFRDIAVASDGLALQARTNNAAGDFTFNWSIGATSLSFEQGKLLLGRNITGRIKQDYVHQASVYWQPLLSRFSYGLSLLDSDFHYRPGDAEPYVTGDFTVQRVMLSMRYQAEKWALASELQQERVQVNGFFSPVFAQNQFGQGGYLLAQYRYSSKLTWFGSIDYLVNNKDDRNGSKLQAKTNNQVPDYFGYQHTLAMGFSYNITADWQLSAEHHWVKGTGRLSPVILPDIAANPQQYWQILAMQLMYRF